MSDIAVTFHSTQTWKGPRWEALHPGEDSWLLVEARGLSEGNVATVVMFGHLPEPDGAVRTYLAQQTPDDTWAREFVGTEQGVAGVSVTIDGVSTPTVASAAA